MASRGRAAARARTSVVPLPRRGAVGLAGALPSGRSVAVGLALLALAAGVYAAARSTSIFAVEKVTVVGATPAIARQVRAVLQPDLGSSLVALDGGLSGRLEALPDVRSASYDRAFPHTLVVRIDRELPAAVLRQGDASWLLSERGRVLRPLPRGAHPRLPRVWAKTSHVPEPGAVLASRPVADPMLVVRSLPAAFPARVRTVARRGHELLLVLEGGLELRLGTAREVPLKLAVAAAVLPGLARPLDGGPDYLDVSVPERPVSGTDPQVETRG